ncbi:putative formate dehydrogenase, alpha subunit [uncultured Desulfobacterium sp.]|uniref:Putative formate dehydrogenase, alpha subunit n=1 Tax=uncultured Desulfobacterium sp. TaxID=201089 RepID=A0A445N1D4_9BACT|nr:putative formate dehydrogenase, alpha subunit [uncultured Desulfobacterium sp.]
MTNSIPEVEDADCIFLIGSNTSEAHPLIAHRIFRAVGKGAKLIVVDPRKIQMTMVADIHVRINYGTDVAFLNAIMHEIIKNNWHNPEFIKERTEGFEALEETVKKYSPEMASSICGVPPDVIHEVARLYATSKTSNIMYTLGITEHSHGVDNVKSLANLAMLTGHIGKPSSGVNPMRGQNNVQGACDMGALPNVYPGYQVVTNEDIRAKFEKAWGVSLSPNIGKMIPDMMDGLIDGTVKGMYIFGENSVETDPNIHHVRHALESAELLVVQDIFLTQTAKFAHVVLPGAAWGEVEGTYSNTERKVQRIRKAVEPPGEAMPNWTILMEIGKRLGVKMHYETAEQVFNEMTSLTPSFAGITYERIDKTDIQWPCPSLDHPGTKYLHQEKFTRGLGLFHAIEYRPSEELPDDEFPVILTTGRRYAHYHSRTMTGRCAALDREFPRPMAQIHFKDAERLGLADGDSMKVTSRRGEVITPVRVGDVVPEGSIFMDFHFEDANPNWLLGTSLDPVSKTPDYKVCAVRIERQED